MIFQVFDPYDDNQYNSFSCVPQECFVCYEIRNDLEPSTISLKSDVKYIKNCSCNGWIHKKCLDIWYTNQRKCPICRKEIRENMNVVCAVVPYSTRIYLFTSKSIKNIPYNFILFLILMYWNIEFYLSEVIKKHNTYENHSESHYND